MRPPLQSLGEREQLSPCRPVVGVASMRPPLQSLGERRRPANRHRRHIRASMRPPLQSLGEQTCCRCDRPVCPRFNEAPAAKLGGTMVREVFCLVPKKLQ